MIFAVICIIIGIACICLYFNEKERETKYNTSVVTLSDVKSYPPEAITHIIKLCKIFDILKRSNHWSEKEVADLFRIQKLPHDLSFCISQGFIGKITLSEIRDGYDFMIIPSSTQYYLTSKGLFFLRHYSVLIGSEYDLTKTNDKEETSSETKYYPYDLRT
jgi:hypothetical protein